MPELTMTRSLILENFLDRFPGFTRAFLDAAQQYFLLAFGLLQIIVRKRGPLLLEFAFDDVPVALDLECCHILLFAPLPVFTRPSCSG